jgi:cytoskeletal protein RodZ
MNFFDKNKKVEIDFDAIRTQELKEMGLCLQEFRQHKSLSLETISEKIHIPIRLLKSIEEGYIQELPEPIYTRELLRKYANYLGLNGNEFADHFHIQSKENQESKKIKSPFNFSLYSLKIQPIYLYFIYVFLLLISVNSLNKFLQISPLVINKTVTIEKVDKVTIPSQTEAQQQSPPSSSYVPVAQKQTNEANQESLNQNLTLEIRAQDKSWVKIMVDGKTEFEGVLTRGTEQKWTAKETITIRTGNAGGLLVTLNKENPKTLGNLGQIQEVTFRTQDG